MARFGGADALFGLDGMGADRAPQTEPDSDDESDGFDLDRDALQDPGSTPDPKPSEGKGSMPAEVPPGLTGMDPKMLEDMMEMFGGMGADRLGPGGMPDPATVRRMMQRPEFKEMMAKFGGGDLPDMGMPGLGMPSRGGDSRASARRERLKERLRQRKGGGEFDIPEATVRPNLQKANTQALAGATEDDDDWLAGVQRPAGASKAGSGKGGAGGGKNKKGKKKGGKKK